MTRAGLVPPLAPGAVPLSVLVDFDGTVSATDVTDVLLSRHATDEEWRARDDAYAEGREGSRVLLAWDATILGADRTRLEATAGAQTLDPSFTTFAGRMRRAGATVEVVSDGLGFYVEPLLERIGAGEVPVATAAMDFEAVPFQLEFPFGHPACFVCGTCKRERVRAHQEAGRFVVFVGDGESDRYGAWQADLVFAKRRLARLCETEGWPYRPWERFADVDASLERALRDGTVPRSREELHRLRAAGRSKRFICGPEAWGEGRVAPGP